MQITIPSNVIKQILSFIKKIHRSNAYTRERQHVFFTPRGLCVDFMNGIRLLFPVTLPVEFNGFTITALELSKLSNAEGDVTFSFDDNLENDNSDTTENESEDDSVFYSIPYPASFLRSRENVKVTLNVTFTQCGVIKQIFCVGYTDIAVDYDYFTPPKETMKSSNFLSAVTRCAPYLDTDNGKYVLSCFCLDKNNIISTDAKRFIVAKNIDIPSVQ